jgi:superfamily I DNA/RNA helicase
VRAALDALWPFLTPQRLVAALLSEEGALRSAAPGFSAAESSAVLRPDKPDSWAVSDVPLLDEAAQLLGIDTVSQGGADKARRRAQERERRAEEKYAREVLQMTGLAGQGFVDAGTLAAWNRDQGPQLTTAERAWADLSWAYGHVIVDEAQELSAMAWRMVMRRIPTRSLTVVGDVAQRGNAAGARSWRQMLDPYLQGRWHEESLTVNYRTPAEIMAVAADVLAAVAPGEQPPESVRAEGAGPRAVRVDALSGVAQVVGEELGEMDGDGRLAVIAPTARVAELARSLPGAVPGDSADVLDSQVALLTVGQSKGLEFDRVVLADPAGIIAQSPVGGHDLYVAITRATHRLTVVYEGDLPPVLHRLKE